MPGRRRTNGNRSGIRGYLGHLPGEDPDDHEESGEIKTPFLPNKNLVRFDGHVHLRSPAGGAEHTLCGVAHDAAESEGDESLRWQPVKGTHPIDCPACAAIVAACQEAVIVEPPELEELRGLAMEQLPNFREQAAKDRARPTVSWIAKGDHLVLVIIDQAGRRTRRFDARLLHVTTLPETTSSSEF